MPQPLGSMPPKPPFRMGSRKPRVDETEGAVRLRGKAADKKFSAAVSTLEFYSKWADLSMLWAHHMLEVLEHLQILLRPTLPGLADTVQNIWIVVKEVTSGPRKGPSKSQDLWIDVEEVMIEPSKGLTDTVHGILDVFLGYEIHKDALVLSNILPHIESLLSFPVTGVRTKCVMLVNKWRVIMELRPLDQELAKSVTQETVHIMAEHRLVPVADVHYRIVLDKLAKIIEKGRCMEALSLKLGREAMDMFTTCLVKDTLTATKVLVQMQDFGDHPDPYIQQSCDVMVARLNFFLTTKPSANDRSLEVDTPDLSEVVTQFNSEYSEDTLVHHDTEELDARAQQDLHDAKLFKAVTWISDMACFLKPSAARTLSSNRLANYDLQNYDDLLKWFKAFTMMDDQTLSLVKPELQSLHLEWPKLRGKIEKITEARFNGKAHMEVIQDEIQRLNEVEAWLIDHGVKHHDKIAMYQASQANATRAKLETISEIPDSSAVWQHAHEELIVKSFQPLKTVLIKRAEDRMWWAKLIKKRDDRIKELLREVEMGQESNQEQENDVIKELRNSLKESMSMVDLKGQIIDNQRGTLNAQKRTLDANDSNLAGMRSEMESTVATMMLEMDKQRSKYYQDVEKGVNETTVALRQQLNAARTEVLLHKQVLNENKELQQENIHLRQDKARLLTAKSQKETECKAAEESIKVITEGYVQLKKTVTELEANVIELQADNDYLLQERDDLRDVVESLKAAPISSPGISTEDATVTSPTQKYARELQHLDSTIMVWEKDLAAAQAKKKTTLDKKNDIDAQILELATQIKALKHPKNKAPEQLPLPPVAHRVQDPVAPTPSHPAPHAPQFPQTQEESPSPPTAPRVRLPVDPASRDPAPTQQQFSALAAEFTSLQTRYL